MYIHRQHGRQLCVQASSIILEHRHRTRLGGTDGTPCSDRTPARLNHRVTTSWTSRTVGLWEAFIYRDRVLLLDSFTWTALHDPVVVLSILYTRKYIMHPPHRTKCKPLPVPWHFFEGHQRGPQNGPYYGENVDTPAKW